MPIIKKDKSVIQSYFGDESGLSGGHADEVYIPQNITEISDFLKDSSERGTALTISGAGTGVTGGRIPFGGKVLSLEALNKIISISKTSPYDGSAVVEPACRISDIKEAAARLGLLYAPDPTERSSFIGGTIATNASGARGLKFGSSRNYIRRLKVVLANGEVIDIKRGEYTADKYGLLPIPSKSLPQIRLSKYSMPQIKTAAGYYNIPGMDLVDLFIGSEGTLGVIAEAELRLVQALGKILGGIAFFKSDEEAVAFCQSVKCIVSRHGQTREVSNNVNPLSLEFFDFHALSLLKNDYPLIPDFSKAAVLFEEEIIDDEDSVISNWTKLIEHHGAPVDFVWLSLNSKDTESFRDFRYSLPERVNEIVHKNGFAKTGTDFAVPNTSFIEMYDFLKNLFDKSAIQHLVFGHIGESHLHANLLPKNEAEFAKSKQIYLALIDKVVALGGTISAEHGIGKVKHPYLERMMGKQAICEMAMLKKLFDPCSILNLGNIFPADLGKFPPNQ